MISLSLMDSKMPLLILLIVNIMASSSLLVSTTTFDEPTLPASTISAAPALLPADSPLASPPALSPDITPLFPSPGGSELSPTESSLPTIPSSPSPPNPDDMSAPGPVTAFSPFGSLPVSSSLHPRISGLPIIAMSLIAFWFM